MEDLKINDSLLQELKEVNYSEVQVKILSLLNGQKMCDIKHILEGVMLALERHVPIKLD